MEEKQIIQVTGQVMVYDSSARQWHPAGTSSGLSTVRLIHYLPNNTFRIHGQKINDMKEVVLDSQITREVRYNRANEAFIQWHDSQAFWGLNFRRNDTNDAEKFFASVVQVLRILNQNAAQQQQQSLPPDILGNQPQQQNTQQQPLQQQQQQPQQAPAAIIQRSIQQQQMLQQQQPQPAPQQLMLHQQPQMINHQQAQQQILGQAPPSQLIQQQPSQLLQQQQLHQHYIQQQQQQQQQQQPQSQSQPQNHNQQINHYQHQHQQHHQQQQQQQQQPQPQQIAPVVAAPIPPPPPPPPAPPALNSCRINGTSINNATINAAPVNHNSNDNNLQHSPVANNGNNNFDSRNGGSPNQAVSLASELSKCQLRKVNLSRSDSDKESECNNNIPNAKTARAASLACVPDNLMSDLKGRLTSIRERIDQQGDGQSMSNNNGSVNNVNNTNGINGDKVQESWLADLIRKEISKEITKMKAEIIDAIKTELRQR